MATHKILKARSVDKTEQVAVISGNPLRGHGLLGAMVAATSIATAEPLALTQNAAVRTILDALGRPDKDQPVPLILDVTDPLAKFVRVKFNGETRPDDVLSYNVTEGWIECGRYTVINGVRRWKKERGRILSYRKTGIVEPFWR
jgi:hypothetical protein